MDSLVDSRLSIVDCNYCWVSVCRRVKAMSNFVLCQVNYEDISQLERFDSVYLDGNLTCKVYESFDNCINQVNCFIFILVGCSDLAFFLRPWRTT